MTDNQVALLIVMFIVGFSIIYWMLGSSERNSRLDKSSGPTEVSNSTDKDNAGIKRREAEHLTIISGKWAYGEQSSEKKRFRESLKGIGLIGLLLLVGAFGLVAFGVFRT